MDMIAALEMAIADEKEAVDKYRECAANAEDAETRLMFEQLAREEESHYKRLQERLRALKTL
ncbi:MAG: ferritin family protein [Acidobacteriota bacterium]